MSRVWAALVMLSAMACAQTPTYTYRVVKTYPHDHAAFTQGLQYVDGYFYEGTGLNGRSTVRKVKVDTGQVVQQAALPQEYFGEGITVLNGKLMQLTWTSGVGFVYDLASFRPQETFRYIGEGWGLTNDGRNLILSDGSSSLRFFDPATKKETGRINITENGVAVRYLNELEWIKGEIWANVWQSDRIARISPMTGKVTGWVQMTGLLTTAEQSGVDVLNGIAYDAKGDRIFVTGKLWPKVFEVKVLPRK